MYCTCENPFTHAFINQMIPVNISLVTKPNILYDFGEGTTVALDVSRERFTTRGFFPSRTPYVETPSGELIPDWNSLGGKPLGGGLYRFHFYDRFQRQVDSISVPVQQDNLSFIVRATGFERSFTVPLYSQGKILTAIRIVYTGNGQFSYQPRYENLIRPAM